MKSVWQWQQVGWPYQVNGKWTGGWIRVKLFDRKIWGDVYYSDRHLVRYCQGRAGRRIYDQFRVSNRWQREKITSAASM